MQFPTQEDDSARYRPLRADPVAACTDGQVKTQRNPELAPQQVTSLRDPDLAPKRGQYAYDTVETHVVRTTVTGECVQTIYWTPDGATQECHPSMFGKVTAPAPAEPQKPRLKAARPPRRRPPRRPPQESVEYEAKQNAEPTGSRAVFRNASQPRPRTHDRQDF